MGVFYSVGAVIISMLFTGVLAYKGLRKKQKNWQNIITLLFLFCAALLFGIFDTLNRINSSQDDKNEIIATSNEDSNKLETKLDTTSTWIVKILTSEVRKIKAHTDSMFKHVIDERVTEPGNPPYPELLIEISSRSNQDGAVGAISFVIQNGGDDDVYDVVDKFIMIDYSSTTPKFTSPASIFAKQTISPVYGIFSDISIPSSPNLFAGSVFIFYRVDSKDKNGLLFSPVRKIVRLTKSGAISVSGPEYSRIKKDLAEGKLW